jgi:hypothetical protein
MLELMHDRSKLFALAGRVEAPFGRSFRPFFRHEAYRVRPGLERDADHFLRRRHLQIERFVQFRLQPRDVVVANMPAIFAQMSRDAVAAGRDRELGCTHRIGMTPAAGIADSCNVIDIDAKAQTFHALAVHAFRLCHDRFCAQLREDGGEMLEVVDLEINRDIGEIGRAPRHADIVDVAVVLGDHLRNLRQ